MASKKLGGILALALGKPGAKGLKSMEPEDDEEELSSEDESEGVRREAAMDLIAAIKSGDADGVIDALDRCGGHDY